LKRKWCYSFHVTAIAVCVCSLPAAASPVLFSDLGTGTTAYNGNTGWMVSGGPDLPAEDQISVADEFTVAGAGSISVGQIDLAIANISGLDTFAASIWTDVNGSPGSEVSGAYWSESTPFQVWGCCGLVSVTGITGVTLTGGQSYFMVLTPLSTSGDSMNVSYWNNQGAIGDVQYSSDDGASWSDLGTDSTLSAFDVLDGPATASTPEPGLMPLLLLGIILAVPFELRRRGSQQKAAS